MDKIEWPTEKIKCEEYRLIPIRIPGLVYEAPTKRMVYSFSLEDADIANKAWGANCGPAALAFFLQKHIDSIRGKIPDFEERGYTSPTMMRSALKNFEKTVTPFHADGGSPHKATMFGREASLVRIQFCGPWTKEGSNPRWAYRHTHWIVSWKEENEKSNLWVYDINCGIAPYYWWGDKIIPRIVDTIKRADGAWFNTHVWRLDK